MRVIRNWPFALAAKSVCYVYMIQCVNDIWVLRNRPFPLITFKVSKTKEHIFNWYFMYYALSARNPKGGRKLGRWQYYQGVDFLLLGKARWSLQGNLHAPCAQKFHYLPQKVLIYMNKAPFQLIISWKSSTSQKGCFSRDCTWFYRYRSFTIYLSIMNNEQNTRMFSKFSGR